MDLIFVTFVIITYPAWCDTIRILFGNLHQSSGQHFYASQDSLVMPSLTISIGSLLLDRVNRAIELHVSNWVTKFIPVPGYVSQFEKVGTIKNES